MRRRNIFYQLLAAILFGLIINIVCTISDVYAAPLTIGGYQQMSVNGAQTLTASGGTVPYNWLIIGGRGTLSSPTGDSVIYTAPPSNPYCVNSPIIYMTDSSGQSAYLQIAVNGDGANGPAYYIVECDAEGYCNAGVSWSCAHTTAYNYKCDGTGHTYYARAGYIYCPIAPVCIDNYYCVCEGNPQCGYAEKCAGGYTCAEESLNYWHVALGQAYDLRDVYMKAYGCCPAALPQETGYPQTGDMGSCGSPNVNINSAANIKSGNLYDSLDVAKLTLSYNSIDPNASAVGKKWTHTYNLKLTALSDNVTLILRMSDGDIIYFRLSGSVYYPEAKGGDTSQIVKNTNGTYTRTQKNGVVHNFNSSGNLTSIVDRNGNTTTLTYSGSNLTSITDPNGRTTIVTSSSGLITAITDPAGRVYSLAYTNSLLSTVTDPLGNAWHYTYDASGNMLTKTDPLGNMTRYTYDVYGRLHQSTDPQGQTQTMNYTQSGISSYTAKDSGVWTYTYDHIFVVKTAKTDPLGNTTRYAYDLARNLIATTAPDGSVTSYTYDSNSNVTSMTDPLGNITSYTYNGMNLVTSVTDPRGGVTANTYDARGNLTRVTDPLGAATIYQYDNRGNVTAITDANNQTTVLAYDTHNNLISITDPLNKVTVFTYDAVGNRLSMTDPLGNVTSYAYNVLNQMTQVTDPKGNITRYTYDYKGSVLSTTDTNGKPTNYTYNYLGQVTQITDALNNLTRMTYGPAGCGGGCNGADKLTALTDALNHSTQYTYDMAGRLVKEENSLGNMITNTYDANGNLITKTKADSNSMTYTYDTNNRLIRKQYSDNSVTQFQYDANGNMTYAGNQNIAYNFTYDANNRMTGITDSNARTIQYQYDLSGNRTTMVTPENRTIAYAYDAARRLTSLTADSRTFSFGYDDDGRRSTLTYPNNTSTSYTYDNNSNLTRLLHTGPGGTTIADINYTYDNVNNRLSKTDITTSSYDPSGTDAMGYNVAHELIYLNSTTYSYDQNGNRIQKTGTGGITTYTYDDENRLTRVEISGTPAQVITYAYDPFGRRIQKNVNGTITNYVYDKDAIILEYNQAGTVQTRYTHGLGIDEPLAMEKNSQMYYYHADGLGSIVLLTSASGSVAQRYDYDAYGNITSPAPTVTQPYTYTAREYDPETGLYFYRARYYDPKAGRFLTRDPIGFAGGINQYVYTGNSPVNWVDPFGLKACCDAQLPPSPIKEVALTCFGEASNGCGSGAKEKRAITDTIYNRVSANRSYWGGGTPIGVLSQPSQFLGYGGAQYRKAENPQNLDEKECQKLKDCITAAQASAGGTQNNFTNFNQTSRPGRTSICSHYFWTE